MSTPKPLEQTWSQSALEARTVQTDDGFSVAEAFPESEHGGFSNTVEVAKFISAAPDMARALMAFRDSGINSRTWDDATGKVVDVRRMADEALRKAGVLP